MRDGHRKALLQIRKRHIVEEYVAGFQAGLLWNDQELAVESVASRKNVDAGQKARNRHFLAKEFVGDANGAEPCPEFRVKLLYKLASIG